MGHSEHCDSTWRGERYTNARSMGGLTRIYSFPYRVYTEGDLKVLEGTTPSNRHRIRIHPFFTVRPRDVHLSPAVPFSKWPKFGWSPGLPPHKRLPPPKVNVDSLKADHAHDALRLDVWGPDPGKTAASAVRLYLSWIRLFTGQEWIGEFEPHTDPLLKNEFRIDKEGRAISEPYSYSMAALRKPWWKLLTDEIQDTAFLWTLTENAPPLHWMLFLDAGLFWATAKVRETVMAATLSLEVARDSVFPRFAKVRERKGLGQVLARPFQGTDLLRHLTTALESIGKPSLKLDQPELFRSVKRLYKARHLAAHGKELFTTVAGHQRKIELSDVEQLLLPTYWTIKWIEELPQH